MKYAFQQETGMDENKVKKGHNILTLKMKRDKSEPVFGLEKIPVESLYRMALELIGGQESYIFELEDKIRRYEEERKTIRQEERVSLMSEIRKEAVAEAKKTEYVQSLKKRLREQDERIKRLYESRSELLAEIARLRRNQDEDRSGQADNRVYSEWE